MSEYLYMGLLLVSAILFSGQFYFQQKFTKVEGSALAPSLVFFLITSVIKIILVLAVYGVEHVFHPYAAFISFLSALGLLLYVYFSAKAFDHASLSLYSIFAVLGGSLLPFVFGVALFNEAVTAWKILSCIFIAISLILQVNKDGGKSGWIALAIYIGVFIANGMDGVFSTFNETSAEGAEAGTYMLMQGVFSIVLSLPVLLFTRVGGKAKKKAPLMTDFKASLMPSVLYGIFTSTGNLLLLIALEHVPASVQYPFVTGGTIVFSAILSVLMKEKFTKKSFVSTVFAVLSAVVLVF